MPSRALLNVAEHGRVCAGSLAAWRTDDPWLSRLSLGRLLTIWTIGSSEMLTTVDGPNIQTHVSITVANPCPPKVNVEHNLIEIVFPGFDLFRPFAETFLQDL